MPERHNLTAMEAARSGADFRHVDAWIFDLDHTLYTLDTIQQGAMEERICLFVQRHFGIARAPAWDIQKRYLKDYGSTLAGLVKHHGVDPDIYHDTINDIAALALQPAPMLRAGLEALPGRRIILTNNCGRFAGQVLTCLGVDDLFCEIIDAQALGFVPKPNPAAYQTLVERTRIRPEHAAFFDDSARNLIPAHALGMITVWFNDGRGQSHWRIEDPHLHIDHETDNLPRFLQTIRI